VSTRFWAATALVLAVALPACNAPREAPPNAGAPTGIPLPPRPYAIPIGDVDPCTLFSADQRDVLGVRQSSSAPADDRSGATCQWRQSTAEGSAGYLIQAITFGEPGAFVPGPDEGYTSVTTLSGFPTVVTDRVQVGLPQPYRCTALVGVAEGQSLEVVYSYNGRRPITIEESCANARAAAELAMQTLTARARGTG
jgi:hypothetical protein